MRKKIKRTLWSTSLSLLVFIHIAVAGDVINLGSVPSKEIEAIIDNLKTGRRGIDISGLTRIAWEEFDKYKKDKKLEHYVLPPPLYTGDMFSYTIVFEKATRRFWIIKSGGFAGVYELYGIGYLNKCGKIEYINNNNNP